MKDSITGINKKITMLADIIQKARMTISSDNYGTHFSSDDTRHIILICFLFLQMEERHSEFKSITLLEVLSKFSIISDDFFAICTQENQQKIELANTLNILLSIRHYQFWSSLIIYSFESLEYEPNEYFNVELTRGTRSSNTHKKSKGIYYTPIDVVNFMISQCLSTVQNISPTPSILDCSCGSGVFLLESLKYIESKNNPHHEFDISLKILKKCIWGIDISQAAVDCCKAVFMGYYIKEYKETVAQLEKVWEVITHSFFSGDSVQLQNVVLKHNELPKQYDCIIGNPPYVTMGKESNLYIPFVENLISHSSSKSCSALIIPLSICYAQGNRYLSIRNQIQNDKAKWTFLNYDRSPDSLFGDQVKTRNTILFRNNIDKEVTISTTTLQRWSSENRDTLFKDVSFCDISEISLTKCIPKLSNVLEKQVYIILNRNSSNLMNLCVPCHSKYIMVLNGTAYNWICAYDHIPPSTDEDGNSYISSTSKKYYFPDEESRDFSIALLSNRIAYWYWIATGDGFHLNTSFITDYNVSKMNFTPLQYKEMCSLGSDYSAKIKKHPTISYNAGKRIISYSHWEAIELIEKIENIIVSALKLPASFSSHINQWYNNQVNCNRDIEKR